MAKGRKSRILVICRTISNHSSLIQWEYQKERIRRKEQKNFWMYKNISDFMKIWNGHIQNNQYACMWAQSCLTLCVPKDCSLPGSFVIGIFLKARIVEWVSISSSRGSTQSRDRSLVSCIVSCIGRWLPYCQATGEIPLTKINTMKIIPRWTTEKFLKNDKEKSYLKNNQKGEEE